MLSNVDALKAKGDRNSEVWHRSGFSPLIDHLDRLVRDLQIHKVNKLGKHFQKLLQSMIHDVESAASAKPLDPKARKTREQSVQRLQASINQIQEQVQHQAARLERYISDFDLTYFKSEVSRTPDREVDRCKQLVDQKKYASMPMQKIFGGT